MGEHHGLLGGMLEAVIKPEWPEDFKRIIDITYRSAAMLAARGWTNQEIANHLGVSLNTVKWYISNAMNTLGIQHRQDLKDFMLP